MNYSDILRFIKAEAFLLSAIPAVAISICFFFEIGYLKFYGVPVGVVEVDIYKIIISCMCLFAFFYYIIEIFYLLLEFASRASKFASIFWISLIPGLLVVLFAYLYRLHTLLWVAIGVWVMFYFYFWSLMNERERKRKDSGGGESDSSLVSKAKIFVFLSIIAIGLSFGLGYTIAFDKVSYFVVADDKVLVEIYGDKLVLASFVKKEGGGTLTGDVEVVKIDEYNLKGKIQRLGKLERVESLDQKDN